MDSYISIIIQESMFLLIIKILHDVLYVHYHFLENNKKKTLKNVWSIYNILTSFKFNEDIINSPREIHYCQNYLIKGNHNWTEWSLKLLIRLFRSLEIISIEILISVPKLSVT
jgi:hypothetical protein